MNSRQRAKAWAIDQNDPDNWLVIPEFNVNPQDVAFSGFRLPILGPEADGREMKAAVRKMVSVVRTEARKRFNSQEYLLNTFLVAWKRDSDELARAGAGGYLPPLEMRRWSDDEQFGARYVWIFQSLKGCIRHYAKRELDVSLELMADAAAQVATLLVNMPIDAETRKALRSQQAANAVSVWMAIDPRQKDKQLVKDCWEQWRKFPARYKSKAAFAKNMLETFDSLTSQPVIERWCRDWEREASHSHT